MQIGVALAALAFALYSCCDALIKSLGSSGLGVNEIAFFATAFSVIPGILSKPRHETWSGVIRLRHPGLMHLRAGFGIVGFISSIYAFSHVPLAEAYSIIFLAPVFVVILSIPLLGERVSPRRWFFLAAGFVGVLLVVRPGFRELGLGHLAALLGACCGAGTGLVMRHISGREQRISIVLVTGFYIMLANGVMMATQGITLPTLDQWLRLAAIGGLMGTGHLLFISANKRSAASHVAPMQYSQIVWALLLGALFFREVPDGLAITGLCVIVLAGLLNILPEMRFRQALAGRPTMVQSSDHPGYAVPRAANDGRPTSEDTARMPPAAPAEQRRRA